MRPTLALLSTGGTITAVGSDRLDLTSYLENQSAVQPGGLLSAVPEAAELADVREVPYPKLVSHALTDVDWLRLRRRIAEILEDPAFDGVVVTHGTNTLEETAYFLSLTLPATKPVVLVGAMRPASALSADGPLNLLNAIRVAAAPQSAGRGVLVTMNDAVFSARELSKGATYRVNAFGSPDLGPLGFADADGKVVFYHRSERHPGALPAFTPEGDRLPRVDIVVSYVGADATMVDAAVAAGAAGIVSAATGAGRPTPDELEALREASARGVVVCQSSRVAGGRVVRTKTTEEAGFVAADNLGPFKARVLLSLALTTTKDPGEIQALFDRY